MIRSKPINVRPVDWKRCSNKNHIFDMIIWGECKACHKTINPEVHATGCDCYDCKTAEETEESDAYDMQTCHQS